MFTHFHYLGHEAMQCARWFCSLENRVEDVSDVLLAVDDFKRETQARELVGYSEEPWLSSRTIVETDQKTFQVSVKVDAPKVEHRKSLYELAVFRWLFHGNGEGMEPELDETLPPIFSYVDEYDNTIYFFQTAYSAVPRGGNPILRPQMLFAAKVQDNRVKIPVQKLPAVAAKKLFARD